ncbi:MAG: lipid-A-disaccharide synthase [bacterium]|nr:lipid-A-disaccharide synthase [bacterium]
MTKLMVIAGEASGDLHGGHVIAELKKLMPQVELFGTGGQQLEQAGTKLFYRAEDMAVIGFKEVLRNYSYYKGIFNDMVAKLDSERPDAVFLVDYAGFNLRFAKEAKARGIPVIFYVAPQVWAWKKGRVKTMRQVIDHLLVLFPFEVDFFAKEGITAHCFGHPLLDIVFPSTPKEAFRRELGLSEDQRLVALLPGSRRNEVLKHLPLLAEVARKLTTERPEIRFVYPLASTVKRSEVEPALTGLPISLVEGRTYDAVSAADLAVVASGTATLETAILQTPLLIFYKVTNTTYAIGKYLLGIKAIGLPNIVLGREAVPEMVQAKTEPDRMAEHLLRLLDDPQAYAAQKDHLAELLTKLGEPGAYAKTGKFLADLLQK